MKKILTLIVALAMSAVCLFSMVGCGDKDEFSGRVKFIDVKLSEESYGVAVSREDADLLNEVNSVLTSKATEIEALFTKYANADETDATLKVAGVVAYNDSMDGNSNYLVMATDAPFAPYEYMVGDGYAGIDIEIGKMIADHLGKTLAIKQTAFDTICTVVNQGGADIGLAGLTITPARQVTVNFSKPYFEEAYQVIVVPEEVTTFDNKTAEEIVQILKGMKKGTKVGSQTGTTGAKYILGDIGDADGFGFVGYSNLTLKQYTTHADAVRDMVNGQVDFCIVDNAVAASIVAQVNAAVK